MVPRGLAVRVLTSVWSGGEPLDQALAAVSGQIPPESRGWLQDVCSGTMRWKGRLDWAIDANALKKKPSGWLRKMLLIAAYQLLVQEKVQPSTVVFETVAEIKKKEGEAPAKFANALLRRIVEQAQSWRDLPYPASGSLQEQANWASLPDWFWKRISTQHGTDWAQKFALSALERPRMWLRARRNDWSPRTWAVPGPIPNSWEVVQGGSIQEKEGFREGEFIVQDLSSQLLVSEIAQAVHARSPGAGAPRALDMCAAPGGKAVGIHWSGFDTVASDADEGRIVLLRQTVERAASGIQVISAAQVAESPPGSFDLVWVDAPCSGSGIVRRHPDVRWLRREKELSSLNSVQSKLIQRAWELVKPGGFLAYSVCSVFEEEGPGIVAGAGFDSYVQRTWSLAPHLQPGGDGFWGALILKPV